MTPISRELQLFPTPWHWFVHGLGLGQNPTGFDAGRATRIRALARAVVQRQGGRFPAFVVELVEVILAACDPAGRRGHGRDACAALGQRVAGFSDPREHARACATAIEGLVKLGELAPDDEVLRRQLSDSLARMIALPASSDRARYEHVHLLANLLLAAARAGWTDLLTPAAFAAGAQLLGPVADLFYQGRGAATWAATLAVVRGPTGDDSSELLRHVLDRIDTELDAPRHRASDGAHEGRDYLAFSLFLTLGAVGTIRRVDLLDHKRRWLEVATADLASLHPRARSSQTLLFVSLLRNHGLLARRVPDPAALVRASAAGYLAATDGCQHDDYLRCTYLVHIARQLDCLAELPARIGLILAGTWTQLGAPGLHRGTPYGSPLMFVAYVLSAMHAGDWEATHPLWQVDLVSIIRSANERNDDVVTVPRIGFALLDAALCLRASPDPGSVLPSPFAA